MEVFTAVFFCVAVATAQAIDFDNLVELPISRGYAARTSSRITGGTEVTPHSLPHQVALFFKIGQDTSFCGGSLISPEWVLTAAHCVDEATSFLVVLGAHEIRNEAESTQVRVVTTHKVVHPEWNMSSLRNDLALLRLPEPVELTAAIQTIRLPPLSQRKESFVGKLALESGWGKESDAAMSIAERLQAVNKTVIAHLLCNTKYFNSIDAKSHICTDAINGQSTCNGDSGGPLVITEDDGQFTQIGVVSFGFILGCQSGWPPVFTRMQNFVEFVTNTTGIPQRE